jgi:formylglycine-generating enzyme required for sulfatase activity
MSTAPQHTFIEIPATTFLMGTPVADLSSLAQLYSGTRESYREESPQHPVTLDAFAIGQTPVTIGQYARWVAAGGTTPLSWSTQAIQDPLLPVVDISMPMAMAFARWMSGVDGVAYRLPSEAEWECAARGTDGRQFPWGDVWHQSHAATRESGLPLQPVGLYPTGASPWGVLDMAGGVWEWTHSLDTQYPYRADDGRNDLARPGRRVIRGGCFMNPIGYARCACRFRMVPSMSNGFLGFRLVRENRTTNR